MEGGEYMSQEETKVQPIEYVPDHIKVQSEFGFTLPVSDDVKIAINLEVDKKMPPAEAAPAATK